MFQVYLSSSLMIPLSFRYRFKFYARICKESFRGDASNSVAAETHVAILSQCHRSIEVAVVTAIADLLLYYVPLRQDFVSLCLVSPKLFG